jgi:hypothetical protein
MNIKNLIVVPLLTALIGVAAAQEVTDDKPLLTIFPHRKAAFGFQDKLILFSRVMADFPLCIVDPTV